MLTAENSELGTMPIIDRNSASAEGSGGEPSKVISIELIGRPSYSSKVELAFVVWDVASIVAMTNKPERSPAAIIFAYLCESFAPFAVKPRRRATQTAKNAKIVAKGRKVPITQNRLLNLISKLKLLLRAVNFCVDACSYCAMKNSRSETRYSMARIWLGSDATLVE